LAGDSAFGDGNAERDPLRSRFVNVDWELYRLGLCCHLPHWHSRCPDGAGAIGSHLRRMVKQLHP